MDKTSNRLKLLVAIASFGRANDSYLARLIAEYRSMSFDVDIAVFCNIEKHVGEGVELHVGLPDKDPRSLPFSHKQLFADRRNDYDLFLYSEDDTLVTEMNIRAFLRAKKEMHEREIPGFFRFEESSGIRNYAETHGSFHWDSTSVRRRGEYTIAFFTNEHAACYLLTSEQLMRAIDSGGYLVKPHQGRYDLQCSAATDPYTQCGLQKVIAVSHIDEFLVNHLPNKYIGSKFGVQELEFRRQIAALSKIASNGGGEAPLLPEKNGFARPKDYYELPDKEMMSLIPQNARTVLSIGCGWGAMEAKLAEEGFKVTAIPIDSVIPGCAAAAGVELVCGDLGAVRKKLADRRFDCLLFSNILHLAEDPVALLASFKDQMSQGAVVVATCPNMARLRKIWTRAGRGQQFSEVDYQASGFHFVSHKVLRNWCESAGLQVKQIVHLLPPSRRKLAGAVLGLADGLLSEECLVVAEARGAK